MRERVVKICDLNFQLRFVQRQRVTHPHASCWKLPMRNEPEPQRNIINRISMGTGIEFEIIFYTFYNISFNFKILTFKVQVLFHFTTSFYCNIKRINTLSFFYKYVHTSLTRITPHSKGDTIFTRQTNVFECITHMLHFFPLRQMVWLSYSRAKKGLCFENGITITRIYECWLILWGFITPKTWW